jgi:hypothetical protein
MKIFVTLLASLMILGSGFTYANAKDGEQCSVCEAKSAQWCAKHKGKCKMSNKDWCSIKKHCKE